MKSKIFVKRWVSLETANKLKLTESVSWLGGFIEKGMRWEDYYEHVHKSKRKYIDALRKEIIENNIRYSGADHQYGEFGVPVFSDRTTAVLSFRAWGDLMAAIWSTEEDKDYSYMGFYC